MTEEYLEILSRSLDEKVKLLNELIQLSEKQKEVVNVNDPDWDSFDNLVDKKAELINQLEASDEGFESLYSRIKNEIVTNRDQYKESICKIQEKIKLVVEKSTSLMALEERNRTFITTVFKRERQKIGQSLNYNKVANSYYQNMNKINYIDPQLMDRKR